MYGDNIHLTGRGFLTNFVFVKLSRVVTPTINPKIIAMKKVRLISRWMLSLLVASVMVAPSCSDDPEGESLPKVAIEFDAQLYPLTRTELNDRFRTS